jgi:hypothetical protein
MKPSAIVATLLLALPAAGLGRWSQAPPASPFQLVSGSGYEGAIIPASLVPDWFKEPGVTSTWTPTAADVAGTESRLASYLGMAAQDRSVTPAIVFRPDHPPYTVDNLRDLVGRLSMYKRQYLGLTYGDQRRVLVNGLREGVNHNWRQQVIRVVDGGCGYWHFDFDVRNQHVVRFWCQSSG